MGLIDKFLDFFGLQSDKDEEGSINNRDQASKQEYDSQISEQRQKNKSNTIVSIHSHKNIKIILSEPRSYEETQEIADHLRNKRIVVVNLQRLRPELATRLVDFLTGTVYALSGTISKVGHSIFVCTPDNADVSGHITEMVDDESWT